MHYRAPVSDLLFNIQALADWQTMTRLPGCEDVDLDTVAAILEECARFNQAVLAPLNLLGDRQPSVFRDGQVATSPGFKAAFEQFARGGWQGLVHPTALGGQDLPKVVGTACAEMLHAANLSFALCPMLTDGVIETLLSAGTAEQQALFIPRLLDGRWTGTMNLTEPQAGSDLSLVRTRAQPQSDGRYRLFGTKMFITYGEHDLAENIIHLVLARLPDAPAGVKGLSLFLVPKWLVNPDGSLGPRNDVYCTGLEHKLGIKASPTAVLAYGAQGGEGLDGPGAIGDLVGQPHHGLATMFIMMNASRFGVGIQGLAVAERAYQQAVVYAKERVQSRPVDGSQAHAVAIIHHPDVRRMLMTMRALTEGTRALAIVAASACDKARRSPASEDQRFNAMLYEFIVPVLKGFGTEMSQEVASLGIQVHGGMGYVEDTGVAQYWRDARVLPIYEGTTAIQANDLVGRKILGDEGAFARHLAQMIQDTEQALLALGTEPAGLVGRRLSRARGDFLQALESLVARRATDPNAVFAGSVPYLMLTGYVLVAWQMARSLLTVSAPSYEADNPHFTAAKVATVRFYMEHLVPRTGALAAAITDGGQSVMGVPVDAF